MNSRKNPSPIARRLASALIVLPLLATGCSTFSRTNPEAEKAAGNEESGSYAATEGGTAPDAKDSKIRHLEETIVSLNERIQSLEGKLLAFQTRPDERMTLALKGKNPDRHPVDGTPSSSIRASIAASDPTSGFTADAAVQTFQQGKILFDQEKFPESVLAFSAFLEGHANHALASSAQYFIGENYYRQGDYAVAAPEFEKLITRYPHSPRTSHALVRLSQSATMNGKTEDAKRYRIQAEGLFPKSPALKLFREGPGAGAAAPAEASARAPIATAPDLAIEAPRVPAIKSPEIEIPTIEKPSVEAPHVEAPRARISGDDLDAPPGGGG